MTKDYGFMKPRAEQYPAPGPREISMDHHFEDVMGNVDAGKMTLDQACAYLMSLHDLIYVEVEPASIEIPDGLEAHHLV